MSDENWGCFDVIILIVEIIIIITSIINIATKGGTRLDYGILLGCMFHILLKVLDYFARKSKKNK